MLILINVVIAMMADTYAMMTSVRKGVYNYNIIQTSAAYKLDKYYGGLIIWMPPFCIFTFALIPFYICIKDREKLKVFNERVLMVSYMIILVPLCFVHAAINLILVPLAYLKNICHKINLTRKQLIDTGDLVSYIFLGLPILILAQFTDLCAFIKASACTDKRYQSDSIFVISKQQFYSAYKIFSTFERKSRLSGL